MALNDFYRLILDLLERILLFSQVTEFLPLVCLFLVTALSLSDFRGDFHCGLRVLFTLLGDDRWRSEVVVLIRA